LLLRLLFRHLSDNMHRYKVRDLVVFIVILIIVAAVLLPGLLEEAGYSLSEEDQAVKFVEDLRRGIDFYKRDSGDYPKNIENLIMEPASAVIWRGPYIIQGTNFPKDPWGTDIVYKHTNGANDYTLLSCGPDGQPDTTDDIKQEIILFLL
jgi:general secretion pathway protein G